MHDFSSSCPPADRGDDYANRFGGIARLYGAGTLATLRSVHVAVIGIGGVGSWAAESLARSGIGTLTLVDLDELCVTNVNRQIHALEGVMGRSKVQVMAERIRAINPDCQIHPVERFFHEQSAAEILAAGFDGVIDAIDAVQPKCLLLARCRERGIPVVSCGAAGGRRDATAILVADLSRTYNDALLLSVRKDLRNYYGFPKGEKPKKFGIRAVFSPENVHYPQPDGTVCRARPEKSSAGLRCDAGFGTATHITATFGLFASSEIIKTLAGIPE